MLMVRVLVFIAGIAVVASTITGALRTFVLPRGSSVWLTRWVFRWLNRLFRLRANKARSYRGRDSVMALFAPTALLTLPVAWIALVMVGYAALFWSLGVTPAFEALRVSGSSLLTLGFAPVLRPLPTLLAFSEATIGLGLIALLIAYLPAIYAAFSRRETAVAMLEIRAGSPPSPITMFERANRLDRLGELGDVWSNWELWFTQIEESHTSLDALVFFRSPQPEQSWITAAGTVLDAAALAASTLDIPRDVRADLCLRSGYLALRHIADTFQIEYDPDPDPEDPISISRHEFEAACDQLAASGIGLKADRDQAWRHYAGWRVNYDSVLLALAALTMAPYAPWISDRSRLGQPLQSPIWAD